MKPLPPPEAPKKTDAQEKLEQLQRQRRMSYGMLFGSEHGKVVLADLKARYGWDGDIERPSYTRGMPHADMTFIEGQKEVVRHILAMTEPPQDNPQSKPTTATT